MFVADCQGIELLEQAGAEVVEMPSSRMRRWHPTVISSSDLLKRLTPQPPTQRITLRVLRVSSIVAQDTQPDQGVYTRRRKRHRRHGCLSALPRWVLRPARRRRPRLSLWDAGN